MVKFFDPSNKKLLQKCNKNVTEMYSVGWLVGWFVREKLWLSGWYGYE